MAAASILEVVEDFILGDTSFEDDFQDFALEHCDIFDNKEENKLEYTKIYKKFTALFDGRIGECLREHGYTPKEFYQQCREAEKGTSEQRFLVDLILGITNFDAFKDLMLQQKELLRAEEEREM